MIDGYCSNASAVILRGYTVVRSSRIVEIQFQINESNLLEQKSFSLTSISKMSPRNRKGNFAWIHGFPVDDNCPLCLDIGTADEFAHLNLNS